eukprot:TRINITY_DN10472_c0_g1_i1.p1 TRINITY_DN10472_c0_g1~~TRINITY_DN10472_c0_g1_i1.p1  ORF type:complete len:209 (-),score=30.35 TRINITY_DN10472_c0_g1_i1:76-702(-)
MCIRDRQSTWGDLSPSNTKFKPIQHNRAATKICNMVVAVVANDSNDDETTYVLHVNEYSFTEALREGEIKGSYSIGVEEQLMFKFESLAAKKDLKAIQFNVRTITGACKAMVSSVSEFPYFTYEHSFEGHGGWVDIPVRHGFLAEGETMNVTFNVVVKGNKASCRFFISARELRLVESIQEMSFINIDDCGNYKSCLLYTSPSPRDQA